MPSIDRRKRCPSETNCNDSNQHGYAPWRDPRTRWDRHVDLKHGFILLDNTKNGERREIPINQTLKALFQSLTRRIEVPYVFYDPATGKHYKDMKKSFTTACRKAGIRDFHFHDLRHTFASQLVMAGVDLTTVKRTPRAQEPHNDPEVCSSCSTT